MVGSIEKVISVIKGELYKAALQTKPTKADCLVITTVWKW
jgi:hypothetical protein